jgi:hypothetical protein
MDVYKYSTVPAGAVTATAGSDVIPVGVASDGKNHYITSANRQTDIASRSISDLDAISAVSTPGQSIPDSMAVGTLYNKSLIKQTGTISASSSATITLAADSAYLVLGCRHFNSMQCASYIFTAAGASTGQSKKVDIVTAANVTISISFLTLTITNADTGSSEIYSVIKLN